MPDHGAAMAEDNSKAALEYHRFPTPGKIAVVPTKPLATQADLALAYSPGVAAASLLIKENADQDVQKDLQDFFAYLAKSGPRFRHTTEGPDDMPSHIRSALTQVSLGIPLHKGKLALGTWQGIYVFEHRDAAHRREVVLQLIGD